MKWDKKARERLVSKDYQKKFFFSYMIGITIVSIVNAFISKEEFTIISFLRGFLPFTLGGIGGLAIMYFLSKDKRFM